MPDAKPAKHLSARALIVSCQADPGTPLSCAAAVGAMAEAALAGGADGIRTDGPDHIEIIRDHSDCLIIGSFKIRSASTAVFVTPSFDAVRQVIRAGADIVGIQATDQPLADGRSTYDLIRRIKSELGACVMADVSVLDEARQAEAAGADFVTSALAGYTPYSRQTDEPDWALIGAMAADLAVPVIAEGRIWTPDAAAAALAAGAHALVVGTAITDPLKITRRFARALKS